MLAALLAVGTASAGATPIPADKQALILLRSLAYDRNLPARAGDAVRIAALYRAGDAASEAAASDLVAAISKASPVSVAGRPVRVVSLPYNADTLERDLGDAPTAALYLCGGLGGVAGPVMATTRKLAILSFTSEEEMVRGGLSIGLVRRGERAAILVNLVAARAEGADLSAELLRLAEVVSR